MGNLLRIYLTVRKPRNFLWLLVTFIATSLVLHFLHGYDLDFGATNLILSIEASTAGAVLMMVAEESAEWQRKHAQEQAQMIERIHRMAEATLSVAEGVRELLQRQQAERP